MRELFIYRGLPGSGKTTRARILQDATGGRLVGRDHLRELLFGEHYVNGWVHDQDREARVTGLQEHLIREGLRADQKVIVDDLNLRSRYVRRLIQLAHAEDADVSVIDLTDEDVEDCITRDAGRGRSVGETVIRDLHRRFIAGKGYPLPVPELPNAVGPAEVELYVPCPVYPKAVIVDIDGTVAKMDGRSPYDYSRVAEDLPNWPVIEAVRALRAQAVRLVFVSGRPDSCRYVTRLWLNRWVACVPDRDLLMRKAGDSRNDAIVKREIFDAHIRNHYNVLGVFDDRQRVVDMWRSLGLTVFQVAPGDF